LQRALGARNASPEELMSSGEGVFSSEDPVQLWERLATRWRRSPRIGETHGGERWKRRGTRVRVSVSAKRSGSDSLGESRARSGVDTGPILDPGDESFLDPMREDIGQPGLLRLALLADDDGLVAAGPDLLLPAGQAALQLGLKKLIKRAECFSLLLQCFSIAVRGFWDPP
jgi:hypothetical protein